MQIREFSKPITSQKLNEGLAQQFGYKLNLEQFTDVQLEDARNKLRTKISQFEVNESFDSMLENQEYQKTRMFLDVINQEIMEREEGKCPDCHCDPCECDDEDEGHDDKMKNESKLYPEILARKAKQHSVPDAWVQSALERINLGESDQEELSAELQLRYDLNEDVANHIVYLAEGEEDKAEIIMATKDMVDRITGWLEDVAAMKAEQLLELQDSIRETMGSATAQTYTDAVKPALEAIYAALETSRQGLSTALATVSGGEAPMMGAPAGAPEAGGLGAELSAAGAEMGGALPSEGPPAVEPGREKRESVDYSRRLSMLLNSKKK